MSNDWYVPSFPLIYLCSLSATVTQCLRGCETMGNHVTSRLVGRASVHSLFCNQSLYICCIATKKNSQSFFNVQGNKKTQKHNKKDCHAWSTSTQRRRKWFVVNKKMLIFSIRYMWIMYCSPLAYLYPVCILLSSGTDIIDNARVWYALHGSVTRCLVASEMWEWPVDSSQEIQFQERHCWFDIATNQQCLLMKNGMVTKTLKGMRPHKYVFITQLFGVFSHNTVTDSY